MFGRLVTFVAATLVALFIGGGTASAETYGNKVSTSCNVSVSARPHQAVSARVAVTGNASNAVHGTVAVTVTGARGGTVWSTTVPYNGAPVDVTGPVLPTGRYRAAARFSADPGVYLNTKCFSAVNTSASSSANPGSNAGALPNTGGPSQWWLALGFGLMLAGGASVYGSRRQKVRA